MTKKEFEGNFFEEFEDFKDFKKRIDHDISLFKQVEIHKNKALISGGVATTCILLSPLFPPAAAGGLIFAEALRQVKIAKKILNEITTSSP